MLLRRARFSFLAKTLAAAALAALADALLYGHGSGSVLGAFALAWTVATLAVRTDLRSDPRALAAAALAAAFAGALIDRPQLLTWSLFWIALAMAALLPRTGRFDDAWRWLQRLIVQAFAGIPAPFSDLLRMRRSRGSGRLRLHGLLPVLALPLIGGAVFLALFAAANPIIADALDRLEPPKFDLETIARGAFWMVVLMAVWATLRPRLAKRTLPLPSGRAQARLAGVSVASVTLSLLVFNALFALQNGLDLAFLWSGAPLPEGVTLAEYAHRGAYPLIATALLAGLFVLVALAPGSATAANRLCRALVVLWVLQNLLLVASSVLRTIDYVEVYSLTRLRIAALAWMGLVGVGLALICWRMLRGKSAGWLVNANTVAAGLVLAAATVVDLGAVAAAWNVRHAREVGGQGTALDLCYLNRLGGAALVPLAQLERGQGSEPAFRARVATVRAMIQREVEADQADWRDWTWRDARRLERAVALVGPAPTLTGPYDCDGAPIPPAKPVAVPVAPQPGVPEMVDDPVGLAREEAARAEAAARLTPQAQPQ